MTAFQWPNTLRSDTYLRITELLSEGPIEGFVTPNEPAKSIYFEQTPLQNENGTMNFLGVSYDFRAGNAVQNPLPGPSTAETTIAVETQVRYNIGPVVRTIVDTNATSVRCMARIPALMQQDSQGNVLPFGIVFFYDVRPAGGDWTLAGTVNLPGQKCTSPFTIATTFTLPGQGPWDIRMRRGTIDWSEVSTWYSDQSWWESYTEIIEARLSYPNSAMTWIQVNAAQFGETTLPTRYYRLRGLKVDVPSNYNVQTRTYSGLWDGTFVKSWSSNPVWLFRDLIVNDRYGLGQFIDASKVDKWSLYQIAQYCDQLVPDGFGGQEPRYQINTQIITRQEAFKLLQQITTAWRGMGYWSLGQVFATADMPADPVKLVTPANVIDGHFKYSGTSLKTRHSVALVTWNDPEDFYRSAIEVVINKDQFEKFGWREVSINAFGCTSRGTAHRLGKWALDTEQYATETVEYTASWDHADVKPGDVISVADPRKANARIGGRVVSTTSNTITIDGDFTPGAGENYQFNAELPDGTIETHPINQFTGRVVHLASNFSTPPQVGAMWAITGTDVNPRQYRVLTNRESEANQFHISALEHDPTKYPRVELGLTLAPIAYSRPNSTVKPVTNITATESLAIINGVSESRISLSWTPGDDFQSVSFSVSAIGPDGFVDYGMVKQPNIDITGTRAGTYTFTVTAYSAKNLASLPATYVFEAKGWAGVDGPYVSMLEVTKGGPNNTFSGKDCRIDWQNNFPGSTTQIGTETTGAGQGLKNPLYRDNVVRVYDPDSDTLLRTDVVTDTFYTYTYENNTKDNAIFNRGPQRRFKISVTIRDNLGRESRPATITPNNPVPGIIIPTVAGGTGQIFVWYVLPDDPDFVGAIIWASKQENFDPLTTTPVYDGINNAVSFAGDQFATYYIRIAGYDQFNKFNLNISPPIAVTVGGTIIDTTPPAIPTGLVLTPSIETADDGTITSVLTATWDASPSDNFAYFDVQIQQDGGGWISFQTSTPNYTWRGVAANSTFNVKVRAFSSNGYPSDFGDLEGSITLKKTTPPGAVTSLGGSASLQAIYLTWTLPIDTDLDHTEIWSGTTNVQADSTKIGTSSGTGFTHSGLVSGQTYYYWVRAVNTSGLAGVWSNMATVTVGKVQTVDIAPLAVDTPQIADVAIIAAKLAADSVTSAKLVDNAVIEAKIADLAITTAKIDQGAITAAKIGAGQVARVAIADQAINATKIADNSITSGQIAANTITAQQIAANTITANEIASQAITADKIAANAIAATNIAAGAITADKIAANAITADAIAANAITAAKIAAGSIDASKIQANSITSNEIATGTITASKLVISGWANNLAPNGDFEEGTAGQTPIGWLYSAGGGGTSATLEDGTNHGTISGKYIVTLNNGGGTWVALGTESFIPVKASGTYEYTVYLCADNGSANGVNVAYSEFDSNQNWIADNSVYTGGAPASNNWTKVGGVVTIGSNTKFVKLGISTFQGTQFTHFDNLSFKQQINTTQITANAITSELIAANAVQAQQIAANAITSAKIDAQAITTDKIAANAVTASQIAANTITAGQIAAGTLTANEIQAGSITGDRITAGTINADRLQVSTQMPASIFVGNTGVTIGTVQSTADSAASAAADPAPRINANSTLIDPGKILISGATTLSSWRNGSDTTKIEGGSIAANTISANKLTIGNRAIDFTQFQWTYSGNRLSWSSGWIIYIKDDGSNGVVNVGSGYCDWTGNTVYIAWQKDQAFFETSGNPFNDASYVRLGTYDGGSNYQIYYGRTQIDGDRITTGTIGAQQIVTNTAVITQAAQIQNATITNAHLYGQITFDKMVGGTLVTTDAVKIGGDRFQLYAPWQSMFINDGTRNRVMIGGDGNGNYGMWVWDPSGNLIFGSGGAVNVPLTGITGFPITSSNISTYIASAAIQDAQIANLSASKISASSLSAINANLGTVTAGVARSSDSKFYIDFDNSAMTISDNS